MLQRLPLGNALHFQPRIRLLWGIKVKVPANEIKVEKRSGAAQHGRREVGRSRRENAEPKRGEREKERPLVVPDVPSQHIYVNKNDTQIKIQPRKNTPDQTSER